MNRNNSIKTIFHKKLGVEAGEITPITTGKFNSSYFVNTEHDRDYVIRIAPDPDSVFLFYERNMMAQEPAIHRLLREKTDVPVAEIFVYDDSRSLIPTDYPISVNAVSGYSGGGRSMIEAYEAGTAPSFELYGLGFEHKHVPELQKYTGLTRRPIFIPSVGNFRQGMLVSVPLHLDLLPGKPKAGDLEAALLGHYETGGLVSVVPRMWSRSSWYTG